MGRTDDIADGGEERDAVDHNEIAVYEENQKKKRRVERDEQKRREEKRISALISIMSPTS